MSSRFPWVTMVERTTNEGFATGVNLGVRGSRAPFLLLLNPDCVADGEAIAGLVDFAESAPEAAVIGPRILNADGIGTGIGAPLSRPEHVHRRPELLADPDVPEQSAVALEPAGPSRARRIDARSTGSRARAC